MLDAKKSNIRQETSQSTNESEIDTKLCVPDIMSKLLIKITNGMKITWTPSNVIKVLTWIDAKGVELHIFKQRKSTMREKCKIGLIHLTGNRILTLNFFKKSI